MVYKNKVLLRDPSTTMTQHTLTFAVENRYVVSGQLGHTLQSHHQWTASPVYTQKIQ
jgi:hypothetical protein